MDSSIRSTFDAADEAGAQRQMQRRREVEVESSRLRTAPASTRSTQHPFQARSVVTTVTRHFDCCVWTALYRKLTHLLVHSFVRTSTCIRTQHLRYVSVSQSASMAFTLWLTRCDKPKRRTRRSDREPWKCKRRYWLYIHGKCCGTAHPLRRRYYYSIVFM